MKEQNTRISAPDGTTDAFICHPDGDGPWPGVILYTDIGGIREAYEGKARRIAAEGYAVLMPNVFYRAGRPPMFSFPINFTEERTIRRIGELKEALPPGAMDRDSAVYVDFFAAQDSVKSGKMGVVGYCFTGAMAVRTAAIRPDKIGAAASFHGGWLYTSEPTSPHLVLPRVKAELYFGHAIEDNSMPAESIEKLNSALESWGGKYGSEVYEGCYHSWTTTDSPVYDKVQADRAFAKLIGLFRRNLNMLSPIP